LASNEAGSCWAGPAGFWGCRSRPRGRDNEASCDAICEASAHPSCNCQNKNNNTSVLEISKQQAHRSCSWHAAGSCWGGPAGFGGCRSRPRGCDTEAICEAICEASAHRRDSEGCRSSDLGRDLAAICEAICKATAHPNCISQTQQFHVFSKSKHKLLQNDTTNNAGPGFRRFQKCSNKHTDHFVWACAGSWLGLATEGQRGRDPDTSSTETFRANPTRVSANTDNMGTPTPPHPTPAHPSRGGVLPHSYPHIVGVLPHCGRTATMKLLD
jgi:hypothetical protein